MSRKITKTRLATWSDPEIGGLPVPPAGRKDYGYRLTHGVSVRVYSEHRMVQVAIPDPVTGARRWAEVGEWNIESNDADALKAKAIDTHNTARTDTISIRPCVPRLAQDGGVAVFPSPLSAARNTAIAAKIVQWPGWAPSASKGGGPAILRIG